MKLVLRHRPENTHPWMFYLAEGSDAGAYNRRDDAIRAWLWALDPPNSDEVRSKMDRWRLGVWVDESVTPRVHHTREQDVFITYEFRDEIDAVQFRLRWA